MNNDPEISLQQQRATNKQAKAKFTTLALEFAHTLERLPKINTEIQWILSEIRELDYDGLISRIEPQLEQATALLEEIDFLPDNLKNHADIVRFTDTLLQQITLRTVVSIDKRFREQCKYTKQTLVETTIDVDQSPMDEKTTTGKSVELHAEVMDASLEKSTSTTIVIDADLMKQAMPSEMVTIPSGMFVMGHLPDRDGFEGAKHTWEEPAHTVKIKRFLLSKYPITFAEFDAYCDVTGFAKPSDYRWGRGSRPLMNVSWDDVQQYVAWLKEVTGQAWRLPSEAEWEYAARAKNDNTAFPWGKNADKAAANYDHMIGRTTPVGEYPPNDYGLYDMHGNVWEWCQDSWHDNYQGAPEDSKAWEGGEDHVLRGGSWFSTEEYIRSAFRYRFSSDYKFHDLGARLALDD